MKFFYSLCILALGASCASAQAAQADYEITLKHLSPPVDQSIEGFLHKLKCLQQEHLTSYSNIEDRLTKSMYDFSTGTRLLAYNPSESVSSHVKTVTDDLANGSSDKRFRDTLTKPFNIIDAADRKVVAELDKAACDSDDAKCWYHNKDQYVSLSNVLLTEYINIIDKNFHQLKKIIDNLNAQANNLVAKIDLARKKCGPCKECVDKYVSRTQITNHKDITMSFFQFKGQFPSLSKDFTSIRTQYATKLCAIRLQIETQLDFNTQKVSPAWIAYFDALACCINKN